MCPPAIGANLVPRTLLVEPRRGVTATIPADRAGDRNVHPHYASCCSAESAPQAAAHCPNNESKINYIYGYYAILTCHDAVSMVRAAFEGGGVISINRSIV